MGNGNRHLIFLMCKYSMFGVMKLLNNSVYITGKELAQNF